MTRRRRVSSPPRTSNKARTQASPNALIDPKVLQELIDIFHSAGVADLEVERQGLRVRLRREEPSTTGTTKEFVVPVHEPQRNSPASELAASLSATEGLLTVRSPIVGVFYRSASLEAEPYVEEGAYVTKGQVLCIVEAMKLMNEIECEVDGRVVKILQENAKPVEYGEPLFLIEPGPRAEG